MAPSEIVIVCTQATALSNGDKTGAWAEEIAAPYYVFKDAGYTVSLASPNGGEIPLDQNSLQGDFKTPDTVKWLNDAEAQKLLKTSKKISDIDPESIVGIFGAGGHGAAVDFPNNPVLTGLASKLHASGKLVSTVCHGAELFVGANDSNGIPIVKNKKVTGFSDAEEKAVGKDTIPGLKAPEGHYRELGAIYSKAPADWASHVEVDTSGPGPIVTGQNPGSSEATAKAVVKVLKG